MALLVFEGGGHEEGEDLIEEGAGAELASLVCDLAEGLLAHGGGAVLDLEQQLHDLALVRLVFGHLVLLLILQQGRKELVVLRLDKRQARLRRSLRNLISLPRLLAWHLVLRGAPRGGRGQELAGGCHERLVRCGRLQHLVPVGREERVELVIIPRAVTLVDLLLEAHVVHLLWSHPRGELAGHGCGEVRPPHGRGEVSNHGGGPPQP
mmetsp:Transcript_21279/g.52409  ORF Transcript_21279/g.52409 Transcript_21279/m.52409 type:complete len:208 (-) Transcript_21279:279-902(-)